MCGGLGRGEGWRPPGSSPPEPGEGLLDLLQCRNHRDMILHWSLIVEQGMWIEECVIFVHPAQCVTYECRLGLDSSSTHG